MTFEKFLILLFAASIVTSLLTEAIKVFLDSLSFKYSSNIVVLIISVFVGGFGMACYYLLCELSWTATNIIYIFLMVGANWLCSMLGYDKVMQAITQFKK